MLDERRAVGWRKASRSKSHTRACLTIHAIKARRFTPAGFSLRCEQNGAAAGAQDVVGY
jgi:hypothetical protein